MVYNPDQDSLIPDKQAEQPPKLVDLNVIKKGMNFKSKARKEDQKKEEQFFQAEEHRRNLDKKQADIIKKLEESKKQEDRDR